MLKHCIYSLASQYTCSCSHVCVWLVRSIVHIHSITIWSHEPHAQYKRFVVWHTYTASQLATWSSKQLWHGDPLNQSPSPYICTFTSITINDYPTLVYVWCCTCMHTVSYTQTTHEHILWEKALTNRGFKLLCKHLCQMCMMLQTLWHSMSTLNSTCPSHLVCTPTNCTSVATTESLWTNIIK